MSDVDTDADRLDELKRRVASEHLGNPELGRTLRGGNASQLRADAEKLRDEAGLRDNGRPSLRAELWAWRRRRSRLAERLFGRR